MPATISSDAPVSDLDPFSEAFLRDPYAAHEQLRETGAVVRLEAYGIWGMARHEHVAAALDDHEAYRSAAGVGLADFTKETPWRPPSLLLEADPPEHTRARHAVAAVLTAKRVRTLRDDFERVAEALVEDLLARGGAFDAVADLAHPFPNRVFPDAVGVPREGREHLMAYGNMVFNAFGPRNRLFEESAVGMDEVREWIAGSCRRENLTEDGLGAEIYARAAEHEISAEEAGLLVRSLLSAGVDTTVHGLGNALYCFATHPEQWAALHADPGHARAAFEEALRLESAVQTFFRTTTRDVEVEGVTIPEGEKVLLFLAAANRDPRHWDEPARFDIARKAAGHLGFGTGIHACVGRAIARLEGEVLLGVLARRVEAIELAGEPALKLNNTLRGFERLPVRAIPARTGDRR